MPSNDLANANRQNIVDGFKKLRQTQFSKGRLLGPKNRYLEDAIGKIKTDTATNPITLNQDHISQYIGSSILVHCYDGWNFISRGMDALLNGDIGGAIHFTYYAELRACMSLMAYEGIGIFDRKHIYFNAANSTKFIKKSTHVAAKELIDEWAGSGNKKEVIFQLIRLNNRSLRDWVIASGQSTSNGYASAILNDWLKAWSIDIRLQEDQDLRNLMSYRPHFKLSQVDIAEKLRALITIWQGMEPTPDNRFANLDMHLARIGIEKLFTQVTGLPITHPAYITFIDALFNQLGEPQTQLLYRFMRRLDNPDNHFLIAEASKDIGAASMNLQDPLPMMCRAILLLRMATGTANLMVQECNVTPAQLKFWWEDFCFKNGITSSQPSGIGTLELYGDIQNSINNLSGYLHQITTLHTANAMSLTDLCSLKQFQRICFWGMGL
jgi:hypothetical protein